VIETATPAAPDGITERSERSLGIADRVELDWAEASTSHARSVSFAGTLTARSTPLVAPRPTHRRRRARGQARNSSRQHRLEHSAQGLGQAGHGPVPSPRQPPKQTWRFPPKAVRRPSQSLRRDASGRRRQMGAQTTANGSLDAKLLALPDRKKPIESVVHGNGTRCSRARDTNVQLMYQLRRPPLHHHQYGPCSSPLNSPTEYTGRFPDPADSCEANAMVSGSITGSFVQALEAKNCKTACGDLRGGNESSSRASGPSRLMCHETKTPVSTRLRWREQISAALRTSRTSSSVGQRLRPISSSKPPTSWSVRGRDRGEAPVAAPDATK
jgi:hypothetical protein